jgi:hypothetical protein
MFRLADAYLKGAEAALSWRRCEATDIAVGWHRIKIELWRYKGNITAGDLNLDFILAERSHELFWEAHKEQFNVLDNFL